MSTTQGEAPNAIEETVDTLGSGSQVASVADPFTSKAVRKDGTTAYATITYKVAKNKVTDVSRTAVDKAADQAREAGLTVETGGTSLSAAPWGTTSCCGLRARSCACFWTSPRAA
ncbi:hypothetical protein [Streptomyces sp. NPDC101149]|uniref:hypothetical protein n=1 Tax=Streptomyces sp. NPDC101149 TaxID=3366113 RepID=UPI00382D6B52